MNERRNALVARGTDGKPTTASHFDTVSITLATMRFLGVLPLLLLALLVMPQAASAATCADYSNQAAAQAAGDTRDADGDGIYCESLPCPCSSGGTSGGGGGGTSGGPSSGSPKPKPKPKRHVPAPPGSRPLRAFYTPTKKSACVLFQRNTGSTFIECGINKRTTGYKLSSIGRARLADWQDPRERFPGIAFKTARYGRTQFASNGAWRPMGNADRNIMCLVSVKTGIECTSPDGHGLRISLQYRRAY